MRLVPLVTALSVLTGTVLLLRNDYASAVVTQKTWTVCRLCGYPENCGLHLSLGYKDMQCPVESLIASLNDAYFTVIVKNVTVASGATGPAGESLAALNSSHPIQRRGAIVTQYIACLACKCGYKRSGVSRYVCEEHDKDATQKNPFMWRAELQGRGAMCQPICRRDCANNGSCVLPDLCSCQDGWAHADCTRPVCGNHSNTCQNDTVCVECKTQSDANNLTSTDCVPGGDEGGSTPPYDCLCPVDGRRSADHYPCHTVHEAHHESLSWWNTCSQAGIALHYKGDLCVCLCLGNYAGAYCDKLINQPDPCLSNPCLNGGTCHSQTVELNHWHGPHVQCLCETGYHGLQCESQSDVEPLLDSALRLPMTVILVVLLLALEVGLIYAALQRSPDGVRRGRVAVV